MVSWQVYYKLKILRSKSLIIYQQEKHMNQNLSSQFIRNMQQNIHGILHRLQGMNLPKYSESQYEQNKSFPSTSRQLSIKNQRELKEKLRRKEVRVHITNVETKYKMKHGQQFKNMLEARDIVMEHEFNFQVIFGEEILQENYTLSKSQWLKYLLRKTKEFLAESIGNIVSADFKFIMQKKLEGKQAKAHASKNMILNIHSIYRKIILQFQTLVNENTILKSKIDVDQLKNVLIVKTDQIVKDILVNLADNYPQAPTTGGTPRMREVINEVNRMDDFNNDFIFTSGLKIADFMGKKRSKTVIRDDGDYTDFIMKVINKIIEETQSNQKDYLDRTVYEKFVEFNQDLTIAAQDKNYHQYLAAMKEEGQFNEQNKRTTAQQQKQKICEHFSSILSCDKNDLKQCSKNHKSAKKREKIQAQNKDFKNIQGQLKQVQQAEQQDKIIKRKGKGKGKGKLVDQQEKSSYNLDCVWEEVSKGNKSLKATKKLNVGQKIPNTVKLFSRQKIESKQFVVKHSSILRILTKWAGYLEEIFQQPEEYIMRRIYPFKDINNLEFTFRKVKQQKLILINQLKNEYINVKKKFQGILCTSYQFTAKLLSTKTASSFVSNITRFTQTRTISSKINAILTSLMVKYTNILIHHLLKAGIISGRSSHINLICFRVSDLLRAKLHCNERSFITLLKMMYIMDNHDSMKDKFRLMRIKNKLDERDNNIIINYLFMGKIQCQLQLSIYESKGKQKIYYTFSHFVYELTRGNFGAIADLAIMISQQDPLIEACQQTYYIEKQEKKKDVFGIGQKKDDSVIKQIKQIKNTIFQCSKCQTLITNQKLKDKLQDQSKPLCYKCIIESIQKEPEKQIFEKQLHDQLQEIQMHRRNNYAQITHDSGDYILQIPPTGEKSFYLPIRSEKQFRTFLVRINNKIIKQFIDKSESKQTSIDFKDKVDYIDITKKIKQSKDNSQINVALLYLFSQKQPILSAKISEKSEKPSHKKQLIKNLVDSPQNQIIKLSNTIPEKLLDDRDVYISRQNLQYLDRFRQQFKKFRNEKRIIKNIKFRLQIYQLKEKESQKQQWQIFDKICNKLVLTKQQIPQNYTLGELRYRKYDHLELSNLKTIKVSAFQISTLPKWIKKCYNLKDLNLSNNKIETFQNRDQLPSLLEEFDLNDNLITKMDISHLIYLKKVFLSDNKIEQIKIYKKSITNISLSKNKLPSFSVGQNQSLSQLNLSFNKQMITFDMGNNNSISTLNISNNQNLKYFSSLNNKVLQYFYMSNISKIVKFEMSDNKLKSLNLSNQQLEHLDLSNNITLEQLFINGNPKLLRVAYLPPSLRVLTADLQIIKDYYDFQALSSLEKISITNGYIQRSQVRNLRAQAQYEKGDLSIDQQRHLEQLGWVLTT